MSHHDEAPEKMSVAIQIAHLLANGADYRAVAQVKAAAHVEHGHPKSLTDRGVTIMITDGPRMYGADLLVSLEATTADGLVHLPVDNPYIFRNPPCHVLGSDGIEIEDLDAAFRLFLTDAVLGVAKRHGVTGRGGV